jgi:hypothetical protein
MIGLLCFGLAILISPFRSKSRLEAENAGLRHLRRILRSYACYYNGIRTHRSLDKDAPICRPVERTGVIKSRAILGGLHHHV